MSVIRITTQGMTKGTHGSTFGGNPMAMAVGNAVLDEVLGPGFLEHVGEMGKLLMQQLSMIVDTNSDIVEDARGQGLMLGIKCKVENLEMLQALRDQKLLTVAAGDNVIRFLPPLNIDAEHVAEAIEKLGKACQALREKSQE